MKSYMKKLQKTLLILAPSVALLAMLWLSGYAFLFRFWTSIIMVVPPSPIQIIHSAKANTAAMTTEEYICFVFGSECKTALAVAQAESGIRCDAQNVNKGTNSVDIGIMQINSVHLKKKGWKVADLLNCKRNIELAYEIYKGSGWNAWTTHNTGAYKKFLN